MKKSLFQKSGARPREHGVTMVLVAVAMVGIVAMAALSVDVITLYLAKQEAQRAAEEAALAAAKIIALSGITGDPTNQTLNWSGICGGNLSAATLAAQAVAEQNPVSGIATSSVTVTYAGGVSGGSITYDTDCTNLNSTAFGLNPLVTVQLRRGNLPAFFSRIWGNPGASVSATATAEAFNPSNSGNEGNQISGTLIPVQPHCVKPWIVPNINPVNTTCTTTTGPPVCPPFVDTNDGSIRRQGISLNGGSSTGVIGETFWLVPDCAANPSMCLIQANPPQANSTGSPPQPNLLYLPNQVGPTPIAVPSCSNGSGSLYYDDIVGCDQAANYQCGVKDVNIADLSIGPNADTTDGVACLIHQGDTTTVSAATGQDYLNATTFAAPGAYPFQILAGSANPIVATGLASGTPITISSSVVSLPIYDNTEANVTLRNGNQANVTFVGFLQVFINAVDSNGDLLVTVLNVAGCSNNASGTPIPGNSPLPVRLVNAP